MKMYFHDIVRHHGFESCQGETWLVFQITLLLWLTLTYRLIVVQAGREFGIFWLLPVLSPMQRLRPLGYWALDSLLDWIQLRQSSFPPNFKIFTFHCFSWNSSIVEAFRVEMIRAKGEQKKPKMLNENFVWAASHDSLGSDWKNDSSASMLLF